MKFTEEQQSVVDARGQNLLVSAAAGSGKTAVLVERIYELIAGDDGVDVDRLLVVTFTRAAARQMKERVRARIEDALALRPDDARLKRQEILLHNAQITTIDAFCQYIIRDNFPDLELDPQYRVADESEISLLKNEAIERTMDALYETDAVDMRLLADWFCPGVKDDGLAALIMDLEKRAASQPNPLRWLQAQKDSTDTGESYAIAYAHRALFDCAQNLRRAKEISDAPDGPNAYAATLADEAEALQEAAKRVKDAAFDAARDALNGITFGRLARQSAYEGLSAAKKDAVKELRDEVKETIADLKKRFFLRDKEEIAKQSADCQKVVSALIDATVLFMETLARAKREKNLIDFNDMERFALQILTVEETDEEGNVCYAPTQTAKAYRERFAAVMIDEYQDSNLLQEIILSAVARDDNRFMVGDVKQSIYKFRLARPELFMEKLATYETHDAAANRRIDLHHNFRSRPQVLNAVNAVFERLMGEDLGGVRYDEDARLRQGAPFFEAQDDVYQTELLLLDADRQTDAQEAALIAGRIRRLMEETEVSDEDGRPRKLRYGDIVILMRATAGRDEIFRAALEENGIPAYVESRTGYFDAWEVRTMLHFLSAINNPLQDVSLVSAMRAPCGGFSDEEIALIRAYGAREDTDGYFYEIASRFAYDDQVAPPEHAALKEKTAAFLDALSRYRALSQRVGVHELLQTIYDETLFYEIASAAPFGARRAANLRALIERARAYERTSFRGLARFTGYIEARQKYELDEGEANVLDGNADVVRIMTIHKSKGLEFPVVFLARCAAPFSRLDTRGDLLIDDDLGLGLMHVDAARRLKSATLKRGAIARKIETDETGEELRLLYVAMTRAKEKLILTGAIKDAADKVARAQEAGEGETGLLSYLARARANSYLKWILRAIAANGTNAVAIECVTASDQATIERLRALDAAERYRLLKEGDASFADKETARILRERFAYTYAHARLQSLYVKTTVTELKEALTDDAPAEEIRHPFAYDEGDEAPPSFMGAQTEKTIDGAGRGTLYHKAMELLPDALLQKTKDATVADVEAFLQQETTRGRLPAEGSAIDAKDVVAFLKTDIASRIAAASAKGALYRERQFMMGVAANELHPDAPEDETTLVQGVIDCYFEEADGLVLLDYKTDRVTKKETLIERYHTQLAYYARALTQLTGKPVKERLIYSFALREEIAC